MSYEHCELCLAWSGRTNRLRKCCEIRAIASAPAFQRQAFYDGLRATEGEAAVLLAKAQVKAEYQRRVAWKEAALPATGRSDAGRAALAKLKEK